MTFLFLQHQWGQAAGECEDHVHVARGEKFSSARSDPLFPSGGLTLRAVAIAAGNGVLPITCLMESNFYWRVQLRARRAAKARRPCDSPLNLALQNVSHSPLSDPRFSRKSAKPSKYGALGPVCKRGSLLEGQVPRQHDVLLLAINGRISVIGGRHFYGEPGRLSEPSESYLSTPERETIPVALSNKNYFP